MHDLTVVIVEKPSMLTHLRPYLKDKYPGQLFAICTSYLGLYKFQYSRGLCLHEFPVVSEPLWVPRTDISGPLNPVFELRHESIARVQDTPVAVLQSATKIVFAADPDPSGAVAYHVLLTQALGDEAALEPREAMVLHDLSDAYLKNAVANPASTDDPWFKDLRSIGIARRYFDYNFNVNSLALLTPKTVRQGGFLMSKYSLQLLYEFRDRKHSPLAEGNWFTLMNRWKGTGKYPETRLGSIASRTAILVSLENAGLIRDCQITENGETYLESLHPNCRDKDLPSRLELWTSTWPDSKELINSYIRVFFLRQNRFRVNRRGNIKTTI